VGDFMFLLLVVAFFILAWLFVLLCDRM